MSNTPTQSNILTKKITLPQGLKIKDQRHKTLTIREQNVSDMSAVEIEDRVSTQHSVTFRQHLYARCIVSVDGYDGVVTASMLGSLGMQDWYALTDAFSVLSEEGKPD